MHTHTVFIDDDPDIRRVMAQSLALEGLSVTCFDAGAPALKTLDKRYDGVVLCDYNMPQMDGLDVLRAVHDIDPDIPVILLTGQGDVSTAVTAMQRGAYDFIEKPYGHDALIELLKRAMDKRRLALENRQLRHELKNHRRPGPRLMGDSAAMRDVLEQLTPLLDTHADILLQGETGTGKDAVARYIHDNSPRNAHNFVAINCGAVPENLIESELFGHEAGAFTGADKRRIGKFEHAHQGTLFLDEVESMPMGLQVRLLRVLEERRVERLGSNQTIDLDVRIITAAKADLLQLADEGQFRPDLYYRLNMLPIQLPPLRQRREDINLLFHHFALVAAARFGRNEIPLNATQIAWLEQYEWPGNVRELRNAAERYVLTGKLHAGPTLTTTAEDQPPGLANMVDQFERSVIENTLKDCNGSLKEAMALLGVARKTLYEKMKKHQLDKLEFKG